MDATDSRERADLRTAGLVLAVVGALYASSLIGRGPSIDPTEDPTGFARLIGSARGITSALVYVTAMAMHVLGVLVAVRGVGKRHPRFATLSVVLTVAALVLSAAVIGPFVFTWPAIAQSYLAGNGRAMEIVPLAVGPIFIVSVILEGVLLTAGSVLFARLLSKANVPGWVTFAYAMSAPLYATPIPGYQAEVFGSLLLLSAGVGLARTPQGDAAGGASAARR